MIWSGKDCLMAALFVGGAGNIERVYSCFTRVHIALSDSAKAKTEKLASLPGVQNVIVRGAEIQLVVGIDAPRFASLLAKELGKGS